MLAKKSEQYSDYALGLAGATGFAGLIGLIVITIAPAVGANGLVDLQSVIFSLWGNDYVLGGLVASIAGGLAYGTNQTVDAVANVQDSWKETEAAAALVAVGLPIAYMSLPALQTAATGDVAIQGLMFGTYGVSFSHLVDL